MFAWKLYTVKPRGNLQLLKQSHKGTLKQYLCEIHEENY